MATASGARWMDGRGARLLIVGTVALRELPLQVLRVSLGKPRGIETADRFNLVGRRLGCLNNDQPHPFRRDSGSRGRLFPEAVVHQPFGRRRWTVDLPCRAVDDIRLADGVAVERTPLREREREEDARDHRGRTVYAGDRYQFATGGESVAPRLFPAKTVGSTPAEAVYGA